jgi:hypothetical protein
MALLRLEIRGGGRRGEVGKHERVEFDPTPVHEKDVGKGKVGGMRWLNQIAANVSFKQP